MEDPHALALLESFDGQDPCDPIVASLFTKMMQSGKVVDGSLRSGNFDILTSISLKRWRESQNQQSGHMETTARENWCFIFREGSLKGILRNNLSYFALTSQRLFFYRSTGEVGMQERIELKAYCGGDIRVSAIPWSTCDWQVNDYVYLD
jgi:hypothetical protein